jgi:protein-S-isoprenylcysteine O-methyltransferase Ste14
MSAMIEPARDNPGVLVFPPLIPLTNLLLGIALVFALDWVPLLYVPSLLLLHFGIIRREERYLERKFGDDYLTYKARVGRYVWLV